MDFIPERPKKIGEILLGMGKASEEDIKMALSFQQQHPDKRLGLVLSEAGIINHEDIAIALSKQYNLQYINLNNFTLDPKLVEEISEDIISELYFIPLKKLGGNLIVAIDDPTDINRLKTIKEKLPDKITFVISASNSVAKILTNVMYKVKIRKAKEEEEKRKKEKELAESQNTEKNIAENQKAVPKQPDKSVFNDFDPNKDVFDSFISKLKELAVPVNIFLSTGITLQGGTIIAYDEKSIFLKEKKKCQIVVRNAIVGMTFVEPLS